MTKPVEPVSADAAPPSPPLPDPPLGRAGLALWDRLVGVRANGEHYTFLPHEIGVVEACCRQADDLAELERVIERDGYTVTGAAGQSRLNGAVTEARQGRLALARLLGALALPDEDERPMTEAQRRAQKAANVRWARRAPRPGSAA